MAQQLTATELADRLEIAPLGMPPVWEDSNFWGSLI